MDARREIVSTDTGYHMFVRRKVALAIESGALVVTEDGASQTLTRGECRPICWVGEGKMRPLVPLAGLVLTIERGEWVVVANEMTIELDGAMEQPSPHPHVFVSAEALAAMAATFGIPVIHKPAPAIKAMNPRQLYLGMAALVVLSMGYTVYMLRNPTRTQIDCANQPGPAQAMYPRLSCEEARAELDRVARKQATPRAVVLRPTRLMIDAKDVTGPAKLTCDGIEFAVQDARMADPNGPIVYAGGPHSVLVSELPEGALRVSQYAICSGTVGGERPGR